MIVGYEIIKHGVHEMPRNLSWFDGGELSGKKVDASLNLPW